MVELVRSNDFVYLSWAEAMLRGAGIEPLVADAHTSSIEGSIGAIPRRLLVLPQDLERAKAVLEEAEGAASAG